MKIVMMTSVVVALLASACGDDLACTEEARPGLEVVILDDAGERVCDADVVANDGTDDESLEVIGEGADCAYYGATETSGTYTVTVSKEGHLTAAEEGVVVEADECHVITENVELTLEAAAQAE